MKWMLALGGMGLMAFAYVALSTQAHIPVPEHVQGDPNACGMASPTKLFSLQSAVASYREAP